MGSGSRSRSPPLRRPRRAPVPPTLPMAAVSRGPASGAVHVTLERPAEDASEPVRDADQCVEVDPGLDALPLEEVDEILGRDVAGCAGRERTAAEAAHRGVENARAAVERGETVRVAGIARVVTVEPCCPRPL